MTDLLTEINNRPKPRATQIRIGWPPSLDGLFAVSLDLSNGNEIGCNLSLDGIVDYLNGGVTDVIDRHYHNHWQLVPE